ncbi:MAG: DUF1501 domain-containing protein [Gemmataceae bacterium]
MRRDNANRAAGVSRRDFLRTGSMAAGLSLVGRAAAASAGERQCIFLLLVGGPSHLDTWDPKPDDADRRPRSVRPIRTAVPGVALGEHFPRMASRADRFAIVRSMHHTAGRSTRPATSCSRPAVSPAAAWNIRITGLFYRIWRVSAPRHLRSSSWADRLATPG